MLIAERNSNRVTERDQTGKILWQHQSEAGAIAADRLPNGNTLITTWNQILEVTPAGKQVWATESGSFRYGTPLARQFLVPSLTSTPHEFAFDRTCPSRRR